MGASIDDQELAMTLLASLPEEFKPLIIALDAVGEDHLSFEKVKGMLLNDAERSKNIGHVKSSDSALFAKRGGHHIFKTSQAKPQRWDSKPNKVFQGNCHFCKERGHFARDCPKKRNKNNFGDPTVKAKSANYVAIQQGDDNSCDEALLASDGKLSCDWIIESGATQHMTNNLTMLVDYVEFKNPQTVKLGDDHSIFAHGKGNCRLIADLGTKKQSIVLKNVLYLPNHSQVRYFYLLQVLRSPVLPVSGRVVGD